jgi:hypothetical protein
MPAAIMTGGDSDVRLGTDHCPDTVGLQLEAMNFFLDIQETVSRFGDIHRRSSRYLSLQMVLISVRRRIFLRLPGR